MSTRPFPTFLALLLCAPTLSAARDAPKADAPTAEAVLRRTADYYKQARSLAVRVDREQKMGKMSMKNRLDVSIERPNKLAIRTPGNVPGVEIVSDGKSLTIYLGPVKKYIQGPAPASLAALEQDPTNRGLLLGALQGTMIFELIADDPYQAIMEGVRTTTYVGEEALDGARVHHLKGTQDQFDWEVWIAAEGDPLLLKSATDLTKSLPKGPQFQGQKFEWTQTFKDWKIDAQAGAVAFAFRPPPGAEKADSLMDALGRRTEPTSALVGKPAPELDLKKLDDEGTLRLADHRGKDVVMLDFWATWCGPCVQELPILVEVAATYKDKGVAFFAINLREDAEKIRKFQADRKLRFPVALDPDGQAGTNYGANAIPMLVLVDKKGIVQAVHVGYNPSIRTTLPKELDAILAGKGLPRPAPPQSVAKAPKGPAPKDSGLERAWHRDGAYSGVATDPKGHSIFAIGARGSRCDVLDPDGKTTRTFAIAASGNRPLARSARLAGGEGLLVFSVWGPSVSALKADGSKLWEDSGGQGVDDVWAADLDGDGTDEAIVGYNGSTGLHVFSADGKRIWKRTDLGNVWNVTAADLDGDGKLQVVGTSARGQVHVFAAKDGEPIAAMNPGLYASRVRVATGRARPPAKGDLLIVAGTGNAGDAILAIDGDRKVRWTTDLATPAASCQCLAVSSDGTRAAAALLGGRVCVVDVDSGRILGQVSGHGNRPVIAWAARDHGSDPLLIVAGDGLTAFRLKPAAPPASGRP